jgi:hypothetical protein
MVKFSKVTIAVKLLRVSLRLLSVEDVRCSKKVKPLLLKSIC